ncbi:MAG: UDP-N-acetylmuramoyl-L-alanyl-D-glutamate--2,6-diaminopimelate ligase [Bacteroidia bacterium]|jgi:UDP-N-acetylmuramoyl-L-alanyl-D-glutamate--2,6-diaminopimelate ligase|nr:UDP-N-acetylmuramoyl-L-alanyl-D-glutamate--2,6-diaminopimelate ligase [Bacteroidota bacterium]MBP6511570.1 UDP-N-acetylmuramoyl-L-alanyl-D-glutamate--2,6-diaminopimelate ligase [Bacteroidia bacterium]MBP7244678.1 UDP-N-acetylmuramoyl-L-alanyl-D-glutamate--2,6-diaminopimelate ligase [Bacteroidia bacterium]
MNLLSDLLYKAGIEEVSGDTSISIEKVCFDSRKVEADTLFIAIRGTVVDGHHFIAEVIAKGATAVVCEEMPAERFQSVTYIQVKDSSLALAIIAANFYDHPSDKLKLIGVTGTNGKTTVVTLLHTLFRQLGYKVGLLSTVVNRINDLEIPSTHTTPDPLQLNALLAKMVDSECSYCFMEVSSHAVVQHRISGLHFDGGVFTNITRDHLDYHKTFEEYIKAKQGFFDKLSSNAFALVNVDDRNGKIMVQNSKATVKTYSLMGVADFKAKILESSFAGLMLNIEGNDLLCRLSGKFNAYNLLSVYGVAMLMGEEKLAVLTAISTLQSPEGRFQRVESANGVIGIIDYAHTPDALQNVLSTIQDIRLGNEQIITVVGCGGDRDKGKRPQMAAIACDQSDRVILTSDNPRNEDPDQIIAEMKVGIPIHQQKKVLSVSDRREAVRTACALAKKGDIILLAGKGHEKYQEIKGVKHPFDDLQVLEESFELC